MTRYPRASRSQVFLIAVALFAASAAAWRLTHLTAIRADSTYYNLSLANLTQNWSNTGLIAADDEWSGVASITGFRGDDLTTATGTDPQTLTGTSTIVDVNANRTTPNTFTTGGVAEFELPDPTVALQGSGTADAPYVAVYLNSTGRQGITVSYRLRDLDSNADNAVQQVALQFRTSPAQSWVNVPSAFVADATAGPNVSGPDINVSATLPADANNLPQLEVRIITTNAGGNDEWVGVDDLVVASTACAGVCPGPPPPTLTKISEIQGPERITPLQNRVVTTQGVVTARARNGFFIQSDSPDSDPMTSEGLFVFTSSTPPAIAAIGHTIRVSGLVTEFSDTGELSPTLTQLRDPFGYETIATGDAATVPAPVVLTAADLAPGLRFDWLERYEGMLISVPQTVVVGPSHTRGTFPDGQFFVTPPSVPTPFREPGIEAQVQLSTNEPPLPNPAALTVPRFDTNPEVLRVDTDELFAYDGTRTPGVTAAVGASAGSFKAVLAFEDRRYNALPVVSLSNDVRSLLTNNVLTPVQPLRVASADQFTLSSANLEFFTSSDTARVQKVVRTVCDILKAPDILGTIEVDSLASLNDVAAGLNSFGGGCTGSQYTAFLTDPDTATQNTGFLIRTNRNGSPRVTVNDLTRVNTVEGGLDPSVIFTTGDRKPYLLRATLALGGENFPLTVVLHHPKSLIDSDVPAGDADRQKRLNHAVYAASLVKRLQTENPSVNLALMGDLNAYEFSDGLVDVTGILRGDPPADATTYVVNDSIDVFGTPGVSDLLNLTSLGEFPASERYSYSFRGNRQALDHVLVNPRLYSRLRGYAIAHVNSIYPDFDPVTGLVLRTIVTRPEGYSDHDVPVAYFASAKDRATEVTTLVRVTSSGLTYNRASGVYSGTLSIRLNGPSSLAGPIQIVLTNIPQGITFINEAGIAPEGPLYFVDTAALTGTATVTIPIQLRNTTGAPPSWTPRVFSTN